jgi:hypothetical protein
VSTGGAARSAGWLSAMPLLDAARIKDPWYGLILIVMGLVVFIPMMFFLERRRRAGGEGAWDG